MFESKEFLREKIEALRGQVDTLEYNLRVEQVEKRRVEQKLQFAEQDFDTKIQRMSEVTKRDFDAKVEKEREAYNEQRKSLETARANFELEMVKRNQELDLRELAIHEKEKSIIAEAEQGATKIKCDAQSEAIEIKRVATESASQAIREGQVAVQSIYETALRDTLSVAKAMGEKYPHIVSNLSTGVEKFVEQVTKLPKTTKETTVSVRNESSKK